MDESKEEKILKLAIEKEEEAYNFYRKALSLVKEPGAITLIKNLAEEELKHKEKLEGLDIKNLKFHPLEGVQDLHISEFLVDKLVFEGSTFQDILTVAMKREQKAYDFFRNMTQVVEDPAVKSLFQFLANEELKHKQRIESYYDEIVYREN